MVWPSPLKVPVYGRLSLPIGIHVPFSSLQTLERSISFISLALASLSVEVPSVPLTMAANSFKFSAV